jgi:hypothetical protein
MDDGEVDEFFSETFRLLSELEEVVTVLPSEEQSKKRREKPRLVRFGLGEHEAEAWLDQEPDYKRCILRQRSNGN